MSTNTLPAFRRTRPYYGRAISTRGVIDQALRYTLICRWARQRYTDKSGALTISTGRIPSVYSRIENAAAVKYLGCSPHHGPRI